MKYPPTGLTEAGLDRVTYMVTPHLRAALAEAARREDRSSSSMLRQILAKALATEYGLLPQPQTADAAA
jgi:hypothetical protein